MTNGGKNAIITGSTSGVGIGVADAFAGAAMNVMLNGSGNPDEVEATRARLAKMHGGAVSRRGADRAKAEQIGAPIDRANADFGRVDVLVNDAGIQHMTPVEDCPVETRNAIPAADLGSTSRTTRLTLPRMKQRGRGRIIDVASAHGPVASPFKQTYVCAKHGLPGLTKTVAPEIAEHDVTVNAICPGYVLTPLVHAPSPDTGKTRRLTGEQVTRDVLPGARPTGQFVTRGQPGALAVFPCTGDAASITGTAQTVDGGWTAQ